MNLNITNYGFSGITRNVSDVQKSIPDLLLEKASIEDIMLAHLEGSENNV
jgi:ABC-2 type transport system ATP-binding protein